MAKAVESSRFVSVGCSLDEFVQHQENKNTFSKTQRDVSLLKKFLVSRNELREIENIDANDLDVLIANFLLQVRKKDGEQYEPTSLRSFVSSFDRYLRKKDYSSTIMEGKDFRKTKEVLVAKQKELKKEGKGNKPNAARMLTDEEVDILYGQDLLGCSSSEALINTIWLNNTQFFGLRGCQEHRDMGWGDVERKETADGTVFLEYSERQTKTRTGADPKDSRTVKPKMFAVVGSERDPVRAYDLYASKRPDDLKTPDSPFYLAINHTTKAVNTKPWFKSAPMGVWGSTYKSNLKRLTILQKRAIRIVNRSGCDAHTDPIFKELRFLKMKGIYLLQLGQFMYSFSTGNLPTKFDSFFSVNNSIHSYNTRHASFYRLPLCRTNIRQFSISFQGPKFFNTLSSEIKNSLTLMSFKYKLKDFLINNY